MIMKTIACLIISLLTGGCALAQPETTGAPWNVTLKVVDENGQPVAGARASVGYTGKPLSGQVVEDSRDLEREIAGLTDLDGNFTASHSDTSWNLGIDVQKAGYYSSHRGYDLSSSQSDRNPTFTIVLKKIGHPIPMYAKSITYIKFPVFDKPIGYDLMAGDWVVPYGKGIDSDIFFEKEYYEKAPNDYYSRITISFPNREDGIQRFTAPEEEVGSGLRSPHEVPLTDYQSELTRETSAHPGQPSKFEYDENRIYFFRTTLSDGPHYGKIYGDFMQFRYYLNPTPNDRNVEFDPKHNLLKGIKSFEQVTAP